MDWWRMEYPSSRDRKIFVRGRNFQEDHRLSPNFRLRNLKTQSPKKSNSIPPSVPYPNDCTLLCIDSLLCFSLLNFWRFQANDSGIVRFAAEECLLSIVAIGVYCVIRSDSQDNLLTESGPSPLSLALASQAP